LKKLILVFVLNLIFVFAAQSSELLKNIPNDSPNYSYAKLLIEKTKSLNFIPPKINTDPKTEDEYIKAFSDLLKLKIKQNSLPSEISELQNKTSLLKSQNDALSRIQLTYFEKLLEVKKKEHDYLQQTLPKFEKQLYESLKDVNFNTSAAKKEIDALLKKETINSKEIEKLKIYLQKWELLNDKTKTSQTMQNIQNILARQKDLYKKLLENYTVLWLEEIKNKNKHAFETDDYIFKYAKKINRDLYDAVTSVVNDFEKFAFGAKVFVYGAKKEFELVTKKAVDIINYPIFTVGGRTITPLNFAMFILVLILGWIIGIYYKKMIYRLKNKKNISYSTATLLANMGYYTILTFSFLTALKVVGLDLSSLAIIAGALSVGIGFGLQNIVSNFVSGIILMFERSIKVGDYIQIDQDTRGEVIDISMRSTIIRTNDNINLIIPNQSFIQNNVINWTLGDDIVRFRVPFGVAYGSDIDEVEHVILNAIEKSSLPYIKKHYMLNTEPMVVFMEMGESSLNFELFIWVKGEYARRPRRTRSAFLKVIYKALNDAGINIPFPQQDLHIKDSVPLEITLKK